METGSADKDKDDLYIAVRRDGEELSSLIRVELRYHSGGMQSSRSFDRADRRFSGSSSEMLKEAMAHLFSELRYRVRTGADFRVWFSGQLDMELIEQAAALHAADDETLTRFVDSLAGRGCVRE
ncbi:MAG: hypothetical protein H7A35_12120 [Planctomycetales bacterium]|nr:hypothetical protein [bacterium]UNM07602.1 MAG: hypothetical protein H7A35_12120 [Planctomycetales bacterium]